MRRGGGHATPKKVHRVPDSSGGGGASATTPPSRGRTRTPTRTYKPSAPPSTTQRAIRSGHAGGAYHPPKLNKLSGGRADTVRVARKSFTTNLKLPGVPSLSQAETPLGRALKVEDAGRYIQAHDPKFEPSSKGLIPRKTPLPPQPLKKKLEPIDRKLLKLSAKKLDRFNQGLDYHPGKPTPKERRKARRVRRHMRVAEHFRRHPEQVGPAARKVYRRQYRKLKRKGLVKGPRPKLSVDPYAYEGSGTAAFVRGGENQIFIRPSVMRGIARGDRWARGVPLHELAHTRQNLDRLNKSSNRDVAVEGGADAWMRYAQKKLGGKPTSLRMLGYQDLDRRLYKGKSKRYIRKGQFAGKGKIEGGGDPAEVSFERLRHGIKGPKPQPKGKPSRLPRTTRLEHAHGVQMRPNKPLEAKTVTATGSIYKTKGTKTKATRLSPEAVKHKAVVEHVTTQLSKLEKAYRRTNRIDVTGPLTSGQKTFVQVLSKKTGLSPRVVGAWVLGEESSSAAASREADSNHNWLNIGYAGGAPQPVAGAPEFRDPRSAARATAKWMEGTWGDQYGYPSASGIRGILSTVGGGDQAQMQAIVGSGWAGSAYGGSLGTYGSVNAQRHTNPEVAAALKLVQQRAKKLGIPIGVASHKTKFQLYGGPKHVISAADKLGIKTIKRTFAFDGSDRNSLVNYANLNPIFARQLAKLAKASGEKISVTNGYRSMEDQKAVCSTGASPCATPGTSAHQFGMAIDADFTPKQVALAAKFGLEHGESSAGASDPPHTELTDPELIRKAAKFGPIRSGWLPTGVEAAQGDLGSYELTGVMGTSTGAAGAYAAATGATPAEVAAQMKAGKLTPQQIFAKLKRLGVGVGKGQAGTIAGEPSALLDSLMRKYGSPAV